MKKDEKSELQESDLKEIESALKGCKDYNDPNMDKCSECIEKTKRALQIAQNINSEEKKFQLMYHLANCFLRIDKNEHALKWYNKVIKFKDFKENKKFTDSYLKIANFYRIKGDFKNVTKYNSDVLKIYEELNNQKGIAKCLTNFGADYSSQGEYKKSLQHYQKALKIFKTLEDESGMMFVLGNIATNYYYQGDIGRAIQEKLKILSYFEKTDKFQTIAREKSTISVFYRELGDYQKAVSYALQALEMQEKIGNKYRIGLILNNLGVFFREMSNEQKALEYYKKSLKMREEMKDQEGISAILNNLGNIYLNKKEYTKALQNFEKSLAIKNKIGDKHGKIILLTNISEIYVLSENNFGKAVNFLEQALELAFDMGNEFKVASIHLDLSEMMISQDKLKKAIEYLKKTDEYLQKEKNNKLLIEKQRIYSKLYSAQKDYKKSLKSYQKYSELKDKIFTEESSQKIAEMQTKYETEKKEKEAELEHARAETLKLKNTELKDKNKLIEKQKKELEKTIEKLNQSEIRYDFVAKELNRSIGTTLIGESEAIKNIIELISTVAQSDNTNVLITGESGTGKEIVARNIHNFSSRKTKNFYAVNSSAIPTSLFESQFFGHEKNAFTGATSTKIGWFEIADKSTLFLDEIGTMLLDQQVKLLRVLEEHKIVRVGSHKEISVNVRVISATNISQLELIRNNKFRKDLYHRLATFVINIPALRDRKEDIPLLVRYFVKIFSSMLNKKITRIENQVDSVLLNYDFPGNVRELRNMVERAILVADSSTLKLGHFVIPKSESAIDCQEEIIPLAEMEKRLISKALKITNFNRVQAAKLLQIERKAVERRMKKYGIDQEMGKR
ncbi:MAG: sigma 54-interacting transcriptional regulator [Candidatus Cloacimonetes bacterium]|nr:sigma 54-interacting transcriptional regulator [Candidatus Cloacimonadota bacterium]